MGTKTITMVIGNGNPSSNLSTARSNRARESSKGQVLLRTGWKMKNHHHPGPGTLPTSGRSSLVQPHGCTANSNNRIAPEPSSSFRVVRADSTYFQLYQSVFNQFVSNLAKEFWDCKKTQMPLIGHGHMQEVNLSDDQMFRLIHLQKFVPNEVWESECTQTALAQSIADFLAATQADRTNCIQYALPGGHFFEQATQYESGISPFQADKVQLFRMSLVSYAHGAFKLVLPPSVSSRMEFYFGSTVILDRDRK
jgi:hypothetical protein